MSRMSLPSFSAVGLSMALAVGSAGADTVTFELIPGAQGANDMSPDGRYIVGSTINQEAYLLDTFTNQMTILPPECSNAVAVSDDGTVVLGDITLTPGQGDDVAAIWTAASGVWTSLGYLPNAGTCPSRSDGYELSADGSVAVGLSWEGCSGRGFRWTQATGMVALQTMANGGNRASTCSANGNLIGGFAQGTFERTPVLWTGAGTGQLLDPPNGDATGEVFGMNEAGTVVVGEWNNKATKWTGPGLVRQTVGAGTLLPGWSGIAMDVADQGTIVGFDFLMGNRRAWIQPGGTGPLVDLKTYVESNGGVMPEEMLLEVCQAITNDGRTIIGHGFGTGAWMIKIVHTCTGDINQTGGVNIDDLLAVINSWGVCQASCPADIAPAGGNGFVNVDDLLGVINAWGTCPNVIGACCTGLSCSQKTQADCEAIGGNFLGIGIPCSSTACSNNDHCADAIDITAYINGLPIPGDNSLATPTIDGVGDVDLPAGSPSCQWIGKPDAAHSTVWYTFTAPPSGIVTISTCGSIPAPFSDSTVTLFTGTCGELVEIGCDEDGCSVPSDWPYYSKLYAPGLTPGQVYYVCVMNPGAWSGSIPGPFLLTISSPLPPPGGVASGK